MSGANSFKFVLLPPQSDTTRDWAKRLGEIVPEARVLSLRTPIQRRVRSSMRRRRLAGWVATCY